MTEHYRQYIRDMMRIYGYYDQGEFDSEEAEQLRDAMETPWHSLSEVERRRIRGLALDLNQIREPKRSVEGPIERGREKLVAADRLRDRGELDEALMLLRDSQDGIHPHAVSLLRSSIWMELEMPEVAAEFDRHAGGLVVRQSDSHAANKIAVAVVVPLDNRLASIVE